METIDYVVAAGDRLAPLASYVNTDLRYMLPNASEPSDHKGVVGYLEWRAPDTAQLGRPSESLSLKSFPSQIICQIQRLTKQRDLALMSRHLDESGLEELAGADAQVLDEKMEELLREVAETLRAKAAAAACDSDDSSRSEKAGLVYIQRWVQARKAQAPQKRQSARPTRALSSANTWTSNQFDCPSSG